MTNTTSRELCPMHKFRPYLHLLKAFNEETIVNRGKTWLRGYDIPVAIVIGIICLIITMILSVWKAFDEHFGMVVFTTNFPMIISMLQIIWIFFALILKNRLIDGTVKRLQTIVVRREFCFELPERSSISLKNLKDGEANFY